MLTENYFENLDINRLHQSVEDIKLHHHPKPGRTTAFLSLMLGEAHIGDCGNEYLYIGDSEDQTYRALRAFAIILKQDNYNVICQDTKLFVGEEDHLGQTFIFSSANLLHDNIKGRMFHRVFNDTNISTQEKYESLLKLALGREIK